MKSVYCSECKWFSTDLVRFLFVFRCFEDECNAPQNINEKVIQNWKELRTKRRRISSPSRLNSHTDCKWYESL